MGLLFAIACVLGFVMISFATKSQDLFMQYYPVETALDSSDSSDVVEAEFTTGLSIRGQYAWLIHSVEMVVFHAWELTASNQINLALSTVQGETNLPVLSDKGCICNLGIMLCHDTEGSAMAVGPMTWRSLPPTIIAAPTLSFYCNTDVDLAALQGHKVWGRIGYTTVPIDQKMYLEIAETFETL